MNRYLRCAAFLIVGAVAGCEPAQVPEWSASEQLKSLEDAAARDKIVAQLSTAFGTPLAPTRPGADEEVRDHLQFGAKLYAKRCTQCHGVNGDGAGAAAEFLKPRPRDYRPGIFKFTSTPYGERPRREDLLRTVREGVVGTSMPSFALLPPTELAAVVDYVILLAQRGETEVLATAYAEAEEEMEFNDVHQEVVAAWHRSAESVVRPLTVMPAMTPESVELGRQAFLTEGCSKCHGNDGRGKTQDNVGTDVWGFPTNAADITAGMLHGGQRPIDIYRRISSGINGTPMPSFRAVFDPEGKDPATAKDPDTMWRLVHYVLHVANQRRASLPPEPSLRAQGPAEETAASAASETPSDGAPAPEGE